MFLNYSLDRVIGIPLRYFHSRCRLPKFKLPLDETSQCEKIVVHWATYFLYHVHWFPCYRQEKKWKREMDSLTSSFKTPSSKKIAQTPVRSVLFPLNWKKSIFFFKAYVKFPFPKSSRSLKTILKSNTGATKIGLS